MRFQLFLTAIMVIMAIGTYAILTGQTAGSLCRDTGRGIIGMARDSDGSNESMAGLRQGVEKFGRAIDDTCSRR